MTTAAELRQACVEAVRCGGAILADRFHRPRTIERKGSTDLVTDADRASEAAVLGLLRQRYPEAAILAEESGAHGRAEAALRFYVDPLDGTSNYAHGLPHFAVTVAVADQDGLLAGATLDPLRGELFSAGRGEGASLGERRLRVSSCRTLEHALLATGFANDVQADFGRPLELFGEFIRRSPTIRRLGSAAIDLAYVAAGRFDGFWEERLNPWDVAAGILLVREAGGTVTDLSGGERMLETGGLVAAAPALVEPILAVTRH